MVVFHFRLDCRIVTLCNPDRSEGWFLYPATAGWRDPLFERHIAWGCGAGKLKLPQFLWGRAACNVWLLVPKRLRDFGATALDENSQHDHEKHTGNYLDHGDAVHNESPFLKVFFYR